MSLWNRYTTRRGETLQTFDLGILGLLTVSLACSYNDDLYEYRHVQLPKQMLKAIPKDYFDGSRGTLKLLWEDEWRGLGITQVGRGMKKRNSEGDNWLTEYHRV